MKKWAMRRRVKVGGALALVVLSAGVIVASSALADPTTGGSMQKVGAPPSVQLHSFVTCPDVTKSATCLIRAMYESEQVTSSPTPADATPTGSDATYSDVGALNGGSVAANTCVDSWLADFDAGAGSVAKDGSITFQAPILGVEALTSSLDATDSAFGAAGTTYPTGANDGRGLEFTNGATPSSNGSGLPDSFGINAAGTTLSMHADVTNEYDQVRVLTACVPDTIAVAIGPHPIFNPTTGEDANLKATVSEPSSGGVDNGPIDGTVDWYIDGNFAGSLSLRPIKTLPSGLVEDSHATLPYHFDTSLTPGYHTIKLVFEGSPPAYGENSVTRTFLIKDPNALF
jgi:hypothetical protein